MPRRRSPISRRAYIVPLFAPLIPLALLFIAGASGQTYIVTDLGTLGGSSSLAHGINDLGHVTGWSTRPDGSTHPFLWTTPSGGMVDIAGNVGGYLQGLWLNHGDQVVGYNVNGNAGFFYNGTFNTLSGDQTSAQGINDSGQIVGLVNSQQAGVWLTSTAAPINIDSIVNAACGESTGISNANFVNNAGWVTGNTGGDTGFFITYRRTKRRAYRTPVHRV